jgi:hypothetical protein
MDSKLFMFTDLSKEEEEVNSMNLSFFKSVALFIKNKRKCESSRNIRNIISRDHFDTDDRLIYRRLLS